MEQINSRLASPVHTAESTAVFRDLIAALENENLAFFDLRQLYNLNALDFELAMALIADWRFRRHLFSHRGGLQEALARAQLPIQLNAEPTIQDALH